MSAVREIQKHLWHLCEEMITLALWCGKVLEIELRALADNCWQTNCWNTLFCLSLVQLDQKSIARILYRFLREIELKIIAFAIFYGSHIKFFDI